jgi:hypothetical protein
MSKKKKKKEKKKKEAVGRDDFAGCVLLPRLGGQGHQ